LKNADKDPVLCILKRVSAIDEWERTFIFLGINFRINIQILGKVQVTARYRESFSRDIRACT